MVIFHSYGTVYQRVSNTHGTSCNGKWSFVAVKKGKYCKANDSSQCLYPHKQLLGSYEWYTGRHCEVQISSEDS